MPRSTPRLPIDALRQFSERGGKPTLNKSRRRWNRRNRFLRDGGIRRLIERSQSRHERLQTLRRGKQVSPRPALGAARTILEQVLRLCELVEIDQQLLVPEQEVTKSVSDERELMTRHMMFRRLDRLRARIQKPTLIDDLLRVAGKTQEQANADLVQAYRLMMDAADLPADELETHLRKLADLEQSFRHVQPS